MELLEIIKEFEKFDMNCEDIISKIENNKAYKQELNGKFKGIREIRKKKIKKTNKINLNIKQSKYKPFLMSKRYTQFTGIDEKFFNSILE